MTGIALLLSLSGCTIDLKDRGNDDSGANNGSDDSGGGGGNLDQWRARGKGNVYLLDGTEDHSLVTVEITGTSPPRDGEAYHGWLIGAGLPDVYLGELPVNEDVVLFQTDVELNTFLVGYTRFEACAGPAGPAAPGEGAALWQGEIPDDAVDILRELLVFNTDTLNNEGSLRAMETSVETVRDYGQGSIDNYGASGDDATNLTVFHEAAEAVSNAVTGDEADATGNGTVTTIPGFKGALVGDDGQATGILGDLDVAFQAFGGTQSEDNIRDALGDSYDCIQNIEKHSDKAGDKAGLATVCGAESACTSIMGQAITNLDYALVGQDEDANGTIEGDEGTIECAIAQLARLMAMPVAVP